MKRKPAGTRTGYRREPFRFYEALVGIGLALVALVAIAIAWATGYFS